MKKRIKIKDFSGKVVVLEKEQSNPDHLKSQQTYKHQIFRDKTKYNRKQKHKNSEKEE
jgi:hypothetical protein